MAYVLLIDDEPDGREALRRLLEHHGHEVACADNGNDGISLILSQARSPDIILLDLLMPQMDGVRFMELIRSYHRLKPLRVILLTANPESRLVNQIRAMGVTQVLAKGHVTFPEIHAAIRAELSPPPPPPEAGVRAIY